MSAVMILCGKKFDGICDRLTGPAEILIEDGLISGIAPAVRRLSGAQVIDLLTGTGQRRLWVRRTASAAR